MTQVTDKTVATKQIHCKEIATGEKYRCPDAFSQMLVEDGTLDHFIVAVLINLKLSQIL